MPDFESITTPPAVIRWELRGRAGGALDILVGQAIVSGCNVESIKPGERYRLDGDSEFLTAYAEEIAKVEGYGLAHELPPVGSISASTTVEPARPTRRTIFLHGSAHGYVARAIDRGLHVAPVGAFRFAVRGTTAALVAWWAAVRGVTEDEARTEWNLTIEQQRDEDIGMAITVPVSVEIPLNINMPARQTITTDIEHDAEGRVTHVEQVETDVKP